MSAVPEDAIREVEALKAGLLDDATADAALAGLRRVAFT
eukprot:CAMPEP_0114531924 /NCGR_PEP_ID=MMETSP0109-20121206/26355_1 /TAXON_ID=29199 /ORGANISM="Chlorarachnion reptans, Strain CCCM449" /LENGTH=38 /DNA_ID= /DNA_START= /DNA_END= /DNA_ORIENTATION=